jgi:hypothetical protein
MDSEINDGVADPHVSHGPVAFGEILQFRKALQENFDKLFGLDGSLSSLDEFAALFRSASELN